MTSRLNPNPDHRIAFEGANGGMVQRQDLAGDKAGWLGSSWLQPTSPRRESLRTGGVALSGSTPATHESKSRYPASAACRTEADPEVGDGWVIVGQPLVDREALTEPVECGAIA